MKAVSSTGFALKSATEELKGDPEIVMKAVSNHGRALQYATEELKADPEIVMRAVSQDGYALRYAAPEFKGDKEMMQHALRQGSSFLAGLKVVLLSGRCCDEIFGIYEPRKSVLRRCAELLGLHPDHVERSGALMRGTVEVQGREYVGCDCELKPSALPACCNLQRASKCFRNAAPSSRLMTTVGT